MNKYVIISGIIAVIIIVIIPFFFWENSKMDTLNLQQYGSYTVDTDGIRELLRIKENTQFTYFIQIRDFNNIKEYFQKEFHLEIPELDLENDDSYAVISFGRELKEIKYKYMQKPYNDGTVAKAEVTFDEEYHDKTMYVYIMNKIVIGKANYYIMSGSNRIFWTDQVGLLNERKPDGQQGI